jgi:hypothetical protein
MVWEWEVSEDHRVEGWVDEGVGIVCGEEVVKVVVGIAEEKCMKGKKMNCSVGGGDCRREMNGGKKRKYEWEGMWE